MDAISPICSRLPTRTWMSCQFGSSSYSSKIACIRKYVYFNVKNAICLLIVALPKKNIWNCLKIFPKLLIGLLAFFISRVESIASQNKFQIGLSSVIYLLLQTSRFHCKAVLNMMMLVSAFHSIQPTASRVHCKEKLRCRKHHESTVLCCTSR